MSKLKVILATPHPKMKNACDGAIEVYSKSEADKLIAHQKYNRCLAMAEMCNARYDEADAKENWCGLSWEYVSKEMKYWERWRKRWLELAEKFKEEK